MDRSNSLSSNFRILGSHPPYQRLTHRLTPKIIDSTGIIRIPTKPTALVTEGYSQVKRHDWMDKVSPSTNKQSPNSPVTVLPTSPRPVVHQTIEQDLSYEAAKSYVSSSTTHDWEAECRQIRKLTESLRMQIIELKGANKRLEQQVQSYKSKQLLVWNQQVNYKQKLEETEQRMGEENAYLRECMLKLHSQLQIANGEKLLGLQKQISLLQEENKNLIEQIKFKGEQLYDGESNYNRLVDVLEEQKLLGEQVNVKLSQFQGKILYLEKQNRRLTEQVEKNYKHNQSLLKKLEQEKDRNRNLLSDNNLIMKDIENQKQITEQLRSSVSKLRQQSQGKSTTTAKQMSIPRLNFDRCTMKRAPSQRKSLSKVQSVRNIPNQKQLQFQICEYISKSQQFSDIKSNIQPQMYYQHLMQLIPITQYFNNSVDELLAEKLKNQQLMGKYKRLVQIMVQNPKSEGKLSEFVNDLIERCNLLESSIQQKKSTIDAQQRQLNSLKLDSQTGRSKLSKSPYYSTERQTEQLIGRGSKLQSPSREFVGRLSSETQNTNLSKATSILQRQNPYLKLKNLSGQEILKQMENKLKHYEGEVVPGLQAQIDQYKGMICDYQNSIHTRSTFQLGQSELVPSKELPLESDRGSRISHSFDKRKQRVLVGCNQPFQNLDSEKPGTAQSICTYNLKKKRLDQINRSQLSKDILLILIFRLCEIAQTMTKNSNFVTIVPDSVYIINYSDDNLRQAKLKVLETPKSKGEAIKNYWAPENLQGVPFNEASLVWNIGLILNEIIHCKGHFQNLLNQRGDEQVHPFFKKLIEVMLQNNPEKRVKLSKVEELILNQSKNILK